MTTQTKRTASGKKTKPTVTTKPASIQIDAQLAPLLDLLLKRSNLTLDDLTATSIRLFINGNQDLMTETEKAKYKHLFL